VCVSWCVCRDVGGVVGRIGAGKRRVDVLNINFSVDVNMYSENVTSY
jgi:hypothetical protein